MTSTSTANGNAKLRQGDLRLLQTDLAQQLLHSTIPARMAFVWTDGTPRITPTWFHWTGEEIVMVTYVAGPDIGIRHPAARIAALRANPRVALTIDTESAPPQSLTIRGTAEITEVEGIAPEYAAAARRYLGEEVAGSMMAAMDQPGTVQARISVRPDWVGMLDFVTRLPSVQGGV
ncbi:MAG TPA: pyridoxamine 5'-phosphate oxidase family protein [Streptosporangiaceae bacterium]